MTGLALTLLAAPPARVDLAGLVPDRLAGLDADGVAAWPLPCGGRTVPLAELFRVEAAEDGLIEIRDATAQLDGVGAFMAGGLIRVEGACGAYAGLAMTGGRLDIAGSAGPFLAAEMAGGVVRVGGDAGERLGAPRPGERRGMTGGTVRVAGGAGPRAGERMRGGAILVAGDAGELAAAAMIAGTLIVGGRLGPGTGTGMRRGSLVVRQTPDDLGAGFADTGRHELTFLRLLGRRLDEAPGWLADRDPVRPARRLVGDRTLGGQGEILVLGG